MAEECTEIVDNTNVAGCNEVKCGLPYSPSEENNDGGFVGSSVNKRYDWLYRTNVLRPRTFKNETVGCPVTIDYEIPTFIDNNEQDDNKPEPPTAGNVTTGKDTIKDPTGSFDIFMSATMAHLQLQYDEGRIKGADFAAAVVQTITATLQTATKFTTDIYTAQMMGFKLDFETNLLNMQVVSEKEKAKLTATQNSELVKNGAADRTLKYAQKQAQDQTSQLYERQIKGFDDKNRSDILKQVLDAWAVQGVEIDAASDANSVSDMLYGTNLSNYVQKALQDVGLATTANATD